MFLNDSKMVIQKLDDVFLEQYPYISAILLTPSWTKLKTE